MQLINYKNANNIQKRNYLKEMLKKNNDVKYDNMKSKSHKLTQDAKKLQAELFDMKNKLKIST